MTTRVAATAAALLVTATALVAQRGARPPALPDVSSPAVVSPPAMPERSQAPPPSPLRVARRALRWQLAAEAGEHRAIPERTFTAAMAGELAAHPPAASPSASLATLVSLREQAPIPGALRVLATVRRGTRAEHVTLLVVCRPRCLVASVE